MTPLWGFLSCFGNNIRFLANSKGCYYGIRIINNKIKKMDKLKIFVAVHKDSPVYHDNVYQPVWAGKALSKAQLPWQGDDTGDNISEKNLTFCEMTVHYWAWKNTQSEYVGLCHYRRYFATRFTAENIDREMQGCDIILPYEQYYDYPLYDKLSVSLSQEDKYIFLLVIKQKFPDYFHAMIDYLFNNHKDYAYNMMVCRRELYDEMMTFVFDVIAECEKYVRVSPYTNGARVFGLYAEYLVPIYCLAHRLKIRRLSLVDMLSRGGGTSPRVFLRQTGLYRRAQSSVRFMIMHPHKVKDFITDGATLLGLKTDGIVDGNGKLIEPAT